MKILFLHGLESVPGGTKAQYLEGLGHDVLNPHLPKHDFEGSVVIAQEYIDNDHPDVIVGSSRGGAIAMEVDAKGAKIVLIAPAWKQFDVNPSVLPNTTILHCQSDKIVHYEDSEGISNTNLIPCGENHRMSDVDALEALGKAIENH
jgi:predicted esterase YcpF (UPF0227 family)